MYTSRIIYNLRITKDKDRKSKIDSGHKYGHFKGMTMRLDNITYPLFQ